MQYENVYSLFRSQCAKYGDTPVFYTKSDNVWHSRTWKEFGTAVHELASAFIEKGLTRGASVAILAGNIPEWAIADIAAIAAGGVGVGIYPTSSAEQCKYIIDHSDAEFVIVDTEAQLEKLAGLELKKVKEIILVQGTSPGDNRVTRFKDALDLGREKLAANLPIIEALAQGIKLDDIAIMVYTSGTTGDPKGAMLSHRYILNSVESLRQSIPIFDFDVAFSYLPGCHVAERISGIYNRLYNGTPAYFVDDLSRLYEYMLEVRPTVFASLPRFFEKIHASLMSDSEASADRFDPQKVKDAFGGRIRLLTSGGAPLPNEIARFFADADVPILQAYGLTENICVAFNTVEHLKFGTVGRPMPMCDVRIAEDGEIQVKSPMMFSGYYKQPDKTAEMFTEDGWLKTGDLGEQDADGFLKITGRKKEIIVLSSGKNIAPALIENLVKEDYLISNCFVYGDGRSYCVALITLNQAEAGFKGDYAEMADSPELLDRVAQTVERANSRVSRSEQIKRWKILDRDLSALYDEVTPTAKLKRAEVTKNFKDVLENLYEN
ncbi:MAG: long-chain fatty acid--CoA ligase [Acidobacteria bacterium]|nr:long-chain fatty acid--CoA ligase [Acidobacteriota bacterium]